jgi:hypothetical protein
MRGGYGPGPGRGGPNGMMGPMAGGAMMRGGRGGPPGYPNGNGSYRGESPGGSYGPMGRAPAPGPGYGDGAYSGYNGGDIRDSLPRAESPPPMPGIDSPGPVGQAVEMNAATGSPSHAQQGFGNHFGVRDSDSDIAGIVGLQQQRVNMNHDTMISDGSRYSNDV